MWKKDIWIKCDMCCETAFTDGRNLTEAKRSALKLDWTIGRTKHLCPPCAAQWARLYGKDDLKG